MVVNWAVERCVKRYTLRGQEGPERAIDRKPGPEQWWGWLGRGGRGWEGKQVGLLRGGRKGPGVSGGQGLWHGKRMRDARL